MKQSNTENALREALLASFKECMDGDNMDADKQELLAALTRQVKGCLTAYEAYRVKKMKR